MENRKKEKAKEKEKQRLSKTQKSLQILKNLTKDEEEKEEEEKVPLSQTEELGIRNQIDPILKDLLLVLNY